MESDATVPNLENRPNVSPPTERPQRNQKFLINLNIPQEDMIGHVSLAMSAAHNV